MMTLREFLGAVGITIAPTGDLVCEDALDERLDYKLVTAMHNGHPYYPIYDVIANDLSSQIEVIL